MADAMVPPDIDWLYPDMLSKEGLIHILKQRFIKHSQSDLENLEKEQLVKLFNCYVLPLPQRKYRNNRRGRDMTKKQVLMAKKRKRMESTDGAEQPVKRKGMTEGSTSGLINQFNLPNAFGTRLKPPPSCINFEKKVVKLNSSKKHDGAAHSGESVVIKDFSKTTTTAKLKTSNSLSEAAKSSNQTRKDGLQGKRSNSIGTTEDTCSDKGTGTSSPKKKIVKITWP